MHTMVLVIVIIIIIITIIPIQTPETYDSLRPVDRFHKKRNKKFSQHAPSTQIIIHLIFQAYPD